MIDIIMTEDLDKIIASGEGDTVEFKSRFNDNAIETLVAFSNAKGGKVLIGIDDNKHITGLTIGKETIQHTLNEIKNKTSPSITADIEIVHCKDKQLFIIKVEEYPLKPVSFKGRYYKRIANSNHHMSLNEVVQLHQQTYNSSWDYLIDTNHNFDDISLEKVNSFIGRMNKIRFSPIEDSPEGVMKKFELIRNESITVACFLLFNRIGTMLSTIELGRFSDEISIDDGLTIRDDLFTQAERVMEFVGKHLKKAYVISGDLQREERPDYPPEALREIVLNMIVHRDYSQSSDSIIKIFDDRIEFFNPGGLIPPLTIEKLLSGDYISTTRNKQIANIFKEGGLIERYGSGIKRISGVFLSNGLPMPKFENYQHGFRVTVFSRHRSSEKNSEKSSEKSSEKIYLLIKSNPKITAAEIAKTLGISQRAVERQISGLKQDGRLRRHGGRKEGFWEIMK
jgi:ATP-dependent DNA helicase RecG